MSEEKKLLSRKEIIVTCPEELPANLYYFTARDHVNYNLVTQFLHEFGWIPLRENFHTYKYVLLASIFEVWESISITVLEYLSLPSLVNISLLFCAFVRKDLSFQC